METATGRTATSGESELRDQEIAPLAHPPAAELESAPLHSMYWGNSDFARIVGASLFVAVIVLSVALLIIVIRG
jgi:hypothetical protein